MKTFCIQGSARERARINLAAHQWLCHRAAVRYYSSYMIHWYLVQSKAFQLSYGVQGLDNVALETLQLKMIRYPKSATVLDMSGAVRMAEAGPHNHVVDHGMACASTASVDATGAVVKAAWTTHANHGTSSSVQPAQRAAQPGTPAGSVAGANASAARLTASGWTTSGVISSSATMPGRQGVLIKQPPRSVMVNLVDFVPFLHHRNGALSGKGYDEPLEQQEVSRGPIDFSDIVPDTQVPCAGCFMLSWSDSCFSELAHLRAADGDSQARIVCVQSERVVCESTTTCLSHVACTHASLDDVGGQQQLPCIRLQDLIHLSFAGWTLNACADTQPVKRISVDSRWR